MKSRGDIEALGTPMEIVVAVLSQQLGRTIVNQTGLSGSFDFTLHWVPAETVVHEANALDTSPPAAQLSDDAGPTIFTALEEQLGLRLESQKIPLETIVIDHIEMPSAN